MNTVRALLTRARALLGDRVLETPVWRWRGREIEAAAGSLPPTDPAAGVRTLTIPTVAALRAVGKNRIAGSRD